MRFFGRSLVGLFLAAVTLGLFALAVASVTGAVRARMAEDDGGGPPARERVYVVNAVAVVPETVAPVMTAYGQVRARRELDLRAPATGDVVWVADSFDEGAEVAAGAALVRIDAADATGRRDSARADLSEAEADLRDARRALALARDELAASESQAELRARALTRQQDLQTRGVGSSAQVEEAELQVASAQQSVLSRRQAIAQAEARIDQAGTSVDRLTIALNEAERRLSETEITAPFAGRLTDLALVAGGRVSAGERVALLIDGSALEVAFRISAAQYARLLDAEGRLQQAEIAASLDVSGIDLTAAGRIVRDSPAVGEGQTGRLIFATLTGAAGLRPGDFVTVRITEAPLPDVARLPATALGSDGQVLTVGDDDRLVPRPVELLRRQGDGVLVAGGPLAGARVVTERTPFLGAGIKVRVIGAEAGAEPGTEAGAEAEDLVELDEDRRARLVAYVEANDRMPAEAKERVLAQLRAPRVPAGVVERIESRMGG